MAPEEDSTAAARLARLAADARVPDAVRTAFISDPPEPAEGQVWRAKWDDVAELVVLVAVKGDTVTAVPVSLETDYATSGAYRLPAEATTLQVPLVVWAGLSRDLPVRVLDRVAGETADPVGATWPADVPSAEKGRTPGTALHPAQELRVHYAERIASLAEAVWVPAGSGALAGLLSDAEITVAELAELLDVPPNHALAIRRGQRPVTRDQAQLLAQALRRSVDEVVAANPSPPPELTSHLDRPQWMTKVRRLARAAGVSDHEAWQRAAFGTFALAARISGKPHEDDVWNLLLERYFQAALDET